MNDGVGAIAEARTAMIDGRVPVPDGDLITAAMWHLAAEGVRPRLERLALAGALVAMEIDRMGGMLTENERDQLAHLANDWNAQAAELERAGNQVPPPDLASQADILRECAAQLRERILKLRTA